MFQVNSSNFKAEYGKELEESYVINPNFIIGHQYAVERILRDLVISLDEAKCYKDICDWAAVSHLYIYDKFHMERDNNMELVGNWPGYGVINTNDVSHDGIEKLKYFKDGKVLNEHFEVSPVGINLNRDKYSTKRLYGKQEIMLLNLVLV